MQIGPIVALVIWWIFISLLSLFCFRNKSLKPNFDEKEIYELLPVVHDDCNSFSARYVYLVRLAYGNRNKRFFFPNATISIHFLDVNKKNVGILQLKPKLLTENHRRYLRQSSNSTTNSKVVQVLLKRRKPLENVDMVLLNHNVPNGSIVVHNFFVLRLSDNVVFGSKIGKSIQYLQSGFNSASQSFRYVCFGRFHQQVGPSTHLSLQETLWFTLVGLNTVAYFCSANIECPPKFLVCRNYRSLSAAFWVSLYASVTAVLITVTLMFLLHCLLKRLRIKWNDVGCIWLVARTFPFVLFLYNFFTGGITMYLLMTGYRSSILKWRQFIFWLIATSLGFVIYTLVMWLLYMVLYLNGFYDLRPLPRFEFESGQLKSIIDQKIKSTSLYLNEQDASNYSTRNLVLISQFHEKSSKSLHLNMDTERTTAESKGDRGQENRVDQLDHAESISKIIDANYTQIKNRRKRTTSESRSSKISASLNKSKRMESSRKFGKSCNR